MMPVSFRAVACGLLGLALASCGDGGGPLEPPPGSISIACAAPGGAFEEGCFVERSDTAEGVLLTLRQPDGGFRRLLVPGDGGDLTAADGAEPVQVTRRSPTEIEVAIGGARYRLPAQLLAGKGA